MTEEDSQEDNYYTVLNFILGRIIINNLNIVKKQNKMKDN